MQSNNTINGWPFGIPPLLGAKYVPLSGLNLSTGNTDLYTVPSGRKCLILAVPGRQYNTSAGSIVFFMQVKVSGTYYRLTSNTTSVTLTSSSNGAVSTVPIVLNAG